MEIPKDRKMTFIEFVASEETCDGNIDESWLEHWNAKIPVLLKDDKVHEGDCTNIASPCTLCILENWLKEYREYYFDKKDQEEKDT